jgi:dinuclear metal center YbgI/SA1388 family protein
MATVQGLWDGLNEFAPFSLAEKWDNVGLMVGHPDREVSGVLIGLDPCLALFDEAVAAGVNTVVTHHPLIFHPVKKIDLATVEGRLISFAITHELNIIGCHTNFDVVPDGVSHVLAKKLGIDNGAPLTHIECETECGFGWLGEMTEAMAGPDFLQMVAQQLRQPNILVAGRLPKQVKTVALCGGSCGDFAALAMQRGADVFLTSELKHSQARWAEDAGMCLIDCGHFSTENVALASLQTFIHEVMGVPDVHLSQSQDRPLRGYLEPVAF